MPAYELSEGAALEVIEAQCRHLHRGAGFSPTTSPTLQEVQRFMDMAYYKIAGALAALDYDVDQSAVRVVGWLQNLQMYETVIMIELTYPIAGSGQPSTRFEEYVRQRDEMYRMLESNNALLENMGGTKTTSLGGYTEVTGVSYGQKATVNADDDFIPFRFTRGMGGYPPLDPRWLES